MITVHAYIYTLYVLWCECGHVVCLYLQIQHFDDDLLTRYTLLIKSIVRVVTLIVSLTLDKFCYPKNMRMLSIRLVDEYIF
uniref:Uncharacterized protein n=1 Tax=Arundo donax TaxID=35708 RepID=A0A0A9HDX5_ARUDO